eukprot:COSAG05_NODE_17982_length_316_cov_0.668203_1_plen_52_part_10
MDWLATACITLRWKHCRSGRVYEVGDLVAEAQEEASQSMATATDPSFTGKES